MTFLFQTGKETNSKKDKKQGVFFAFAICASLSWRLYYLKPEEIKGMHYSAEVYIEILSIIFKAFMLYLALKTPPHNAYQFFLRAGLSLWLISSSFLFVDNFIKMETSPVYYFDEGLRLLGMMTVCISGHLMIRNLGAMYSDANKKSMQDELTSLPNRRYFLRALRSSLQGKVGVILIDLDHFKKINDIYGHSTGDRVLEEFGRVLLSLSSRSRIPARIGGEEFAVIIRDEEISLTELYAKKILLDASKVLINADTPLSLSIGMGIRYKSEPVEALLGRVDKALYRAKLTGRGRLEWA